MTCWVSSQAAQQPQLVLFTAVRDYLVDLSRQRPIALFLDDLHWADPASIELLRFIGRSIGEVRVLIVATYRSDELPESAPLHGRLPTLVREARPIRLALRPLEVDAVAELVLTRYPCPGRMPIG